MKLKISPVSKPDRILQYWKKEKGVVACIILFGLSFNISMILGPIYQGKLIDAVASGKGSASVFRMALLFILLIGIIQLLRYFKRFFIRRFANSTGASMRMMIYNKIMHMTAAELNREDAGNLMTRTVSDVDLCVEGMRKFTTEIFDTGVLMISYFVSMLFYDVRITLFACAFIPVAMVAAEKLKTIIYKFSIDFRKKSSEITGFTYDLIENAMMYRVNGIERINTENYAKELEDLQGKAVKANLFENSMPPVYNAIAMLGVVTVLYSGGNLVIRHEWTAGMFVSYLAMFTALAVKAGKAAKLFNSVQKSQISWKRIKPYLSEYVEKNTTATPFEPATTLSVENLGFRYPDQTEPVIDQISFSGKSGEIIGITGPVASGKSTLGLSLLGLYPYLGSIRIDGKELTDYTEYERSHIISYLSHSPQLLSDTIRNNITLGEPQDIDFVLQDVCMEEDLKTMPEGADTLVGNQGIRLSGGQQARIALARTLLRKSKLIILDDPFSAVDMKTEEKIIENLKKNYTDSLILIISHRLAIFPQINRILLIREDGTAEYGTHRELLERSAFYSEIFRLQCKEIGGASDEK